MREGVYLKKKKVRIVILIVTILLLISVILTITDKILYENGKSAIFVLELDGGGEVIVYKGIYYSIEYYYPLTSIEEEYQGVSSDWVWFWE